jgi:hypothetical protein
MRLDIKDICDGMSMPTMIETRDYLSRLISARKGRPKSPYRCSYLMEEMRKVTGRPVSMSHRNPDDVWARTMVAYQMILEGYSLTEIGHQMLKGHCAIIHLRDKMQDAFELPHIYGDVIATWDKFQKRIQK